MDRPLHVIGAGGHAKVVIATARAAGFSVRAVYDDQEATWGGTVLGVPIVGSTAMLAGLDPEHEAVVAVGSNSARRKLSEQQIDRRWATVVHPSAQLHDSVVLGEGTVVFANVAIQPDARLGRHVIVNTSASVDHDCQLGDFVHVAPGARLAGNVAVEDGCFLGIGVAVIPGRRIGAWTTVGAGAVVVSDLGDHLIAIGVPARPRGIPR